MQLFADIQVIGHTPPAYHEILTPEALAFVAKLQRAFGGRRRELLQRRKEVQRRLHQGVMPAFLP
ncbi:MAG: malate synthase A, partial [Anaerolineae bacterium]